MIIGAQGWCKGCLCGTKLTTATGTIRPTRGVASAKDVRVIASLQGAIEYYLIVKTNMVFNYSYNNKL